MRSEVWAIAGLASLTHLHLQLHHETMTALSIDMAPTPASTSYSADPLLPELRHLTHLRLTNISTDLFGADMLCKPHLPSLAHLELRSCRLTATQLQKLTEGKSPHGGSRHRDTRLRHLTIATNLSSLEMPLASNAFNSIANLACLTSLDLGGQEVSPGLLLHLRNLSHLSSLTLCRLVAEDGEAGPAIILPALTHLAFTREVRGQALKSLLPQPLLASLSLPKFGINSYEGDGGEAGLVMEALESQGVSLVKLAFTAHLEADFFSASCLQSIARIGVTHLTLRGDFVTSQRPSRGDGAVAASSWSAVIQQLVGSGTLRGLTLMPSSGRSSVYRMVDAAVADHRWGLGDDSGWCFVTVTGSVL